MNKLLNEILEGAEGQYCHVLEIGSVDDIKFIIDSYMDIYSDYDKSTYIDFFETMKICILNNENKQKINNFSFSDYINNSK